MVDIDHFKRVNDTHGHQAGDVILRDAAHLLVGALRSVDVVGRYGGEEFMAVLPQTGFDEARLTADRVRRLIHGHAFDAGGKSLAISVSVGVATCPGPGIKTAADLISVCDKALYRAKAGGRNRVAGPRDDSGQGSVGEPR
jgi:diguanylate cyclase (GGDEF)-like protein